MPTVTADLGSIAAKVRRLRAEHDLTQKALATAAGVSYRTISTIEAGESELRLRTYVKIATALGTTVDDLKAGE